MSNPIFKAVGEILQEERNTTNTRLDGIQKQINEKNPELTLMLNQFDAQKEALSWTLKQYIRGKSNVTKYSTNAIVNKALS